MNAALVHSELNYNFRLFCKTVSKSANWGFDRFRLYTPKWHTKIQVRKPDGTIVDTQDFSSGGYEHEFGFDLSGNIDNEEYEVYIAGVPAGASFLQAYAYPTGYGGTYGRNAEITYWDFSQVNLVDGGVNGIGRIRLENNPVTTLLGLSHIAAGEVNFKNCQLDAETLADALIGIDNSGVLNGSFNYSGNLAAPAERALTAYNNLKDNKGWSITGEVPSDASQYDVDYQAKLDKAVELGIPTPTDSQNDYYNQRLIAYKAAGSFDTDDTCFDFTGDADPAFKLICIKRRVQAIAYGSLIWSTNGVEGNGANAYIDTLLSPAACTHFTRNNAGIFYVNGKNPAETSCIVGTRDSNDIGTAIIPNRGGSNQYWNINISLNTGSFANNASTLGANGLYRTGSDTQVLINGDGTFNTATLGSQVRNNENFYLLAQNDENDPTTPGVKLPSTDILEFVAIGADKSPIHNNIKLALT